MLSTISLFSQVIMTNGVFVPVQLGGTPTYEIVGKGVKSNNSPIVIGKTYNVSKTSYSVITTNDSVVFLFSNGLISKIGTNSNFLINDFQQEILNTNVEPARAILGINMLSLTFLSGEGIFVYSGTNENSMCSVSTSFVDVELLKGKFYFSCTDKSVNILVLEGSLKSHGEKGKTELVEAGTAILANPVQYQSKFFDEKVVMTTKKVKPVIINNLLTEVPLDQTHHWIFVAAYGNIFGVNID